MNKILIVDDDCGIRDLLTAFLSQNNYNVTAAENVKEAKIHLKNLMFDLLIFDIMMPDESGLALTKWIREENINTPLLLLTARDELTYKLEGFHEGADDYLNKPFEPLELLARLNALLRRTQSFKSDEETNHVRFGAFDFNIEKGELYLNQQEIILSSTERIILRYLAENINHPCKREELAKKLGYNVSERTIDVQINRLRQKLKSYDPHHENIRTVRHQGYELIEKTFS